MISAPALWLALLVAAPGQQANIACDDIAVDPVAFYVAHGDIIEPTVVRDLRVWQCVAEVVVEPPEKPRKRKSRRRR